MEGGKPHPAATGGGASSSHHAAADVAVDEAFARDLYVSQLMELGDDDWSSFAPPMDRVGSTSSLAAGAAGSRAQPIVIDDDDDAPAAAAAARTVQLYVPPPLRSGGRRTVATRQQPAPARSATAFLPRPPGGAATADIGTSSTATLPQGLPAAMAPSTELSLRPGGLIAGGAAAPRHAGRRPAARMAARAAPGTGHARGAGNGRWARAENLMAALQANPRPNVAQFGRIWTRIAAAADTPAAVTATTGEGSHAAPAVSAGKCGQHSTPAISAGKGGAAGGMEEEEEVHRNVANENDSVSSKRQALLADRDTPAVFAGMEDGHDNDWYDSVIRDAVIAELQEDPELHGPLPVQYLTKSPVVAQPPPRATAAAIAGEEEEEEGEFSMPNFYKKWGLRPSDLDPDEAGPSTRRPRVLPLADGDLPTFECGICFDTLPMLDLFRGLPCDHKYCLECMTTYIDGKVREGAVPVACPDPECADGGDGGAGVLHPEGCKKAIDFAAFTDWGLRLAEGAVPHDRRAYCPNHRCGILLEASGEAEPAMAACPACQHLLCAMCGGEWSTADDADHRDCSKGPEAAMVKKLADERRWKACPKCRMLVERTAGCRVMSCRCRMVFCYLCGLQIGAVLEGKEKCQCLDNLGVVLIKALCRFSKRRTASYPPIKAIQIKGVVVSHLRSSQRHRRHPVADYQARERGELPPTPLHKVQHEGVATATAPTHPRTSTQAVSPLPSVAIAMPCEHSSTTRWSRRSSLEATGSSITSARSTARTVFNTTGHSCRRFNRVAAITVTIMARSILQIYHLVLATSGSSWEKRPRTTTILVTARFPTDGSDGGEEVGGRKVEWHRGMGHCPSHSSVIE
uniref:RBR-type E3 ubiquitin transferase n=1 Tax=Oryza glumipatula TaxID=40148 RepID=A0A0E0B3D3_9ORYZ